MAREFSSPPVEGAPGELPTWLRAVLEHPRLSRRGWQVVFGPAYIGLFLWVAFLDQLPAELLARGGVGPSVAAVGVAASLAYLLFFLPSASWGQASGLPLSVIATRTFGLRGAGWLTGLLLAGTQLVWLAIAVRFGTRFLLQGLGLIGLLDPRVLVSTSWNGFVLPGPLFLFSSFAWCFAISLTGRYLVRVIAALMNIYPIVTALILGGTMLAALRGLPGYQPTRAGTSGLASIGLACQMILGFFVTAGLLAADFGAVSASRGDVRRGGLVTVLAACWIVATLAILAVAGAAGLAPTAAADPLASIEAASFHAVMVRLLGERVGGLLLLALGLTALAPGCNAAYLFSTRMFELVPRVKRTKWAILAALVAWILIVGGSVARPRPVFEVVGALLAPLSGAMGSDFLRSRGAWPGARRGFNAPGVVAWGVGAVAGLVPVVAGLVAPGSAPTAWPGVVLAYVAAFLTHQALSAAGLESHEVAIPGRADGEPVDVPT